MRRILLVWTAIALGACGPAHAINLVLDYSYDSTNFFGAGNPSGGAAGAQARASLEAAAGYLSFILTDTFDAIQTPAPLVSSEGTGVYTWTWSLSFTNPSGSNQISLVDQSIAANEYRIYAGAKSLPTNNLGIGGPGGWSYNASTNGGGFTVPESQQITATNAAFGAAASNRGEAANDYGNWGGAITFDSDGSTNWHYNHTTSVQSGRSDFYSVALHELAHALGFGVTEEWTDLVSGGLFLGPSAYAANGNANPTVVGGHWTNGTQSTVYGTNIPQEASMDPEILFGTRKLFTKLDAAGLDDIGYSLQSPAVLGDFNRDGAVNAADFTIWRDTLGLTGPGLAADASGNNVVDQVDYMLWKNNFGDSLGPALGAVGGEIASAGVPEPAGFWLMAAAALGLLRARGRR